MTITGIFAFFARSMAYAFALSVIRAAQVAGIFPSCMASITAWKFEPLPDARTAIRFFSVLPFMVFPVTIPECTPGSSGSTISLPGMDDDLHFDDAPTMHLHDNKRDLAFMNFDFFPGMHGNMSKPVNNQTTNSFVSFVNRKIDLQAFIDIVNPHLGIDNKDTFGNCLDVRF